MLEKVRILCRNKMEGRKYFILRLKKQTIINKQQQQHLTIDNTGASNTDHYFVKYRSHDRSATDYLNVNKYRSDASDLNTSNDQWINARTNGSLYTNNILTTN